MKVALQRRRRRGVRGPSGGAALLALPAGYYGWLDLTGVENGDFPTVANKGALVANWTRNGSALAVDNKALNGKSYAKAAATTDYAKLSGQQMGGLISAAKGTMACLFRITLSDDSASPWANQVLMGGSDSLLGIGSRVSTSKIMPYHRGASENKTLSLDYTSDEWRAIVFRWERGSVNRIYARLNGDEAWAQDAITQDMFAVTGEPRVAGGVTGQITTDYIQHAVFYKDQSAELGDAIMAFLCQQGGLSD